MADPKQAQKIDPATLVNPNARTLPAVSLAQESFLRSFNERDKNLGRRRVPRRTFESPVGVLVDGLYELERAYQVGEGGMMISCRNRELEVGKSIVISFYLPTSSTIIVRGVVRSVTPADETRPARYGVEFVALDFQYKREIRNFVASATVAESV
jgi:hypothetical protein